MASVKKMPDFLLIGAAKAGTTALNRYLSEHPQIFMAPKEVRFFAYDAGPEAHRREALSGKGHFGVRTIEDYQALFAGADPERVWGEAAPIYLESETAARRIRDLVPDVKLIACLRNPVDRAFSGYMMQVRAGRERRPLDEALAVGSHVVRASFYAAQVERYLEDFPRDQLRIYLFEEFVRDNAAVLRDIYGFLGVDADFAPDLGKRYNVGTYPKSLALNAVLEHRLVRGVRPMLPTWLRRMAGTAKRRNVGASPVLTPALRHRLEEPLQGRHSEVAGHQRHSICRFGCGRPDRWRDDWPAPAARRGALCRRRTLRCHGGRASPASLRRQNSPGTSPSCSSPTSADPPGRLRHAS